MAGNLQELLNKGVSEASNPLNSPRSPLVGNMDKLDSITMIGTGGAVVPTAKERRQATELPEVIGFDPDRFPALFEILSPRQNAILYYLCSRRPLVTSRRDIEAHTGVNINTVRTNMHRLRTLHLIQSKYYGKGKFKGLKAWCTPESAQRYEKITGKVAWNVATLESETI
jgi:hypothetical protein